MDSGTLQYGPGDTSTESLGYVPQTLAIYEDLTAEQNLYAFGRLHGVTRRRLRERVGEALKWANLTDRRHSLTKTFSGGMQRRLNIACSVLHQPGILLLDEPTVGVDPQSRERIYEMLGELRDRGTAILLTTHQLDEAQFRCDRIAIVDNGRVVQTGTFDQLVTQTVGHDQRLRVQFVDPPSSVPAPLLMDAAGRTGTCILSNVATDLSSVMQQLQHHSPRIQHVVLQQPTLQDVFLHLTGKELRE